MEMKNKKIDGGKGFDWGRTSSDYAKYRDIYPKEFYEKILARNLCVKGQRILDVGTGTGVLPRNLYQFGGHWVGVDMQNNQIEYAKALSKNMDIAYVVSATEDIDFPEKTFDVITACQCFWYFNPTKTAPIFNKILKEDGRILILYMAWLPFEDEIAGASEELILKYSPNWSGAKETMHKIVIPKEYDIFFESVHHEEYPVKVHFTKESWNGRVKACRGIGASLNAVQLKQWEAEHLDLLNRIAPDEFDILHYAAMVELRKKY